MSTNLTEITYTETLSNTEGVSIVQYTASWCVPCKMLTPRLQELEEDGLFTYYKVDVDEDSGLAREAQVMSVPTLFFFKDGEHVKTVVGAKSKADLKALVKSL